MVTCEKNDSIPLIITNNVCDNKWALYMANKLCRGLAIYAWNNAELLLNTISVIIIFRVININWVYQHPENYKYRDHANEVKRCS